MPSEAKSPGSVYSHNFGYFPVSVYVNLGTSLQRSASTPVPSLRSSIMSLNRLTVRAKKSLSDLFSLGNTDGFASLVAHHARSGQIMLTTIRDSPGETVACNKENDVPDPEEFGSCPCSKSSTFSNLKNHSPDKNSPSKCKRLIGSLRRISSLRSIRMSPNRTKEYELSHTTPPEV